MIVFVAKNIYTRPLHKDPERPMARNPFSDKTTQRHTEESRALHASLQRSRPGAVLSRFVANTLTLNANLSRVPVQTRVLETARTFCTILESPSGHAGIGMTTGTGEIPHFMAIADIFGDKVAAWSEKQTLIREMCSCNYGSADGAFGMGSAMRSDVDAMVEMVDCLPREDPGKTAASLVLVLSAPWGLGLGERFWRLFSVRKGVDGKIIDSEFVLTSLHQPPARQGRTVFGDDGMRATSKQVEAFRREARATCIDAVAETVDSPTTVLGVPAGQAASCEEVVSKQKYDVAMSLVRDLRAQLSSTKEQLEASHRDRDVQVAQLAEKRVTSVQDMLHSDIANLYAQLDIERTHTQDALNVQQQTQVYMHVMEGELTEFDEEIQRFQSDMAVINDRVTELNGRLLVSEDDRDSQKRTSLSKSRKNTELERQVRVLQSKLDAQIESTTAEKRRLEEELLSVRQRLDESKRTSASTLSSVYDARDAEAKRVQENESKLRAHMENAMVDMVEQKTKTLVTLSRCACHLFAEAGRRRRERRRAGYKHAESVFLWILKVARVRIAAKSQVVEEKIAPAVSTAESVTQTDLDTAPSGDSKASADSNTTPFPADAVASAKSCISVLERFVDRAQTPRTSETVNNNAHSSSVMGTWTPQQDWHCVPSDAMAPGAMGAMRTHYDYGHGYGYELQNGNYFHHPQPIYNAATGYGYVPESVQTNLLQSVVPQSPPPPHSSPLTPHVRKPPRRR